MNLPAPIVTIDGPAASGKTSVSRELARRLGWTWVSTGAFYRGLAFVAVRLKVPLNDEEALVQLCSSGEWKIELDEERTRVFLNQEEVTYQVYMEEYGTAASQISQLPRVRQALLTAQRLCAVGVKGLVAEGRDCGTVVFPMAEVKIYLTASSQHRAQRRAIEQGRDLVEMEKAQSVRDAQDTQRQSAPLQIPPGGQVIDTTHLGLEDVVDEAEKLVRSAI